MLILRKPWDSQPQEVAEVNSGPSFVWTPTQGNTREAISGIEPTSYAASGAQAVEAGAAGFAARGGSNRASRWDATRFRGSTDYTLLAVVLDDVGRGVNRNPFDADNTSGTRVFQFRVDSGNKLSFIPFNTSGSNWPVGGATNTPSDRPIVIAARAQNNNLSVWLEGRRDGTSTASGTLRTLQTSGAQLSIGATPTASYTQGFGGQIYLCVHYPYALSDAELSSMRTPGEAFGFVFAPRSIWVPVSSSASGTSYTITPSGGITFSGSGTEVHTKVIDVSGGVTFAGTGNMAFATTGTTYTISPSGGITFAGTGVQVRSKTITPTGGITFSGSGLDLRTKVIDISGGVTFGGTGSMTSNTSVVTGTVGERTKVGVGT